MTIAGLVGATVTVVATTLDDAIWLVPYVGSSSWATPARILHACLFVTTLEVLAIASVIAAFVIREGASAATITHDNEKKEEIVLGSIGAILCWILALFFYIKKLLKRRKRRMKQQQHQEEERIRLTTSTNENHNKQDDAEGPAYGSSNDDNTTTEETEPPPPIITATKPFTYSTVPTVISLTTLGALDEISYFPALIVGKIFTPMDICCGTFLAALIILAMVTCCLARCQPLADCLDRIPIYAVIALFATVLTLDVLYDVFMEDD
jgi:cadmium resistance protein CadD (predicted permease)